MYWSDMSRPMTQQMGCYWKLHGNKYCNALMLLVQRPLSGESKMIINNFARHSYCTSLCKGTTNQELP